MPSVRRQIPHEQTNGPPPEMGGLLSRATPVSEVKEDWVKMVLYGRNGVGKTTLASKFPKPLLIISYEPSTTGGVTSVKREPGVFWLNMDEQATAGANVSDLTVGLAAEIVKADYYKSVVVDHVTAFEELLLREIMGWTSTPVSSSIWRGVGKVNYQMRGERSRDCLGPLTRLHCNTIFIGKEKDHNPQKGDESVFMRSKLIKGPHTESFYSVAMGGSNADWLQDACGYICQLYQDNEVEVIEGTELKTDSGAIIKTDTRYVETGRQVRRLRTQYHTNYAARFRSECPENIPEWIEASTADEMYERFMRAVRGEPQESVKK